MTGEAIGETPSATIEIVNVEVDGSLSTVLWRDGVVVSVDEQQRARFAPGAGGVAPTRGGPHETVDADGGALVPGLWDHHLHLAAMAAALDSVVVDPGTAPDASTLARVLRGAVPVSAGWVRAVGYHESSAGDLDARALDELLGDLGHVPVRVQHRSGQMWMLNSAAIAAAGLAHSRAPGIERDAEGAPTGRVLGEHALDATLPDAEGRPDPEFVARLTRVIDGFVRDGVTGVSDLTPTMSMEHVAALREAVRVSGAVHLGWTGSLSLGSAADVGDRIAVKFLPPDHADPDLGALVEGFKAAHALGLPVAVHCVTRVGAFVAIAAWQEAGVLPGDRMEHGAVLVPEAVEHLAALGVTVVTQPNFVAERGDRYLTDVAGEDRGHLWRCGSLRSVGVAVAAGTDAPFGSRDPWAAMRAAVDRRTASGALLGAREAISPADAMRMFLGHADRPSVPRRVRPGERTDLCLLSVPLSDALAVLDRSVVRGTVVRGRFRETGDAAGSETAGGGVQ
jgi:predicted amidohydrolase YtcJ